MEVLTQMKASVFEGPGVLAIKDVPTPTPGPDEVLVRVKVCGVCATDLYMLQGESISEAHQYPLIPGHEFSGVIEAIGANVRNVRRGEKVAIDPIYPCNQCSYCKSNQQNHCEHLQGPGTTVPGGFAEYVSVPAYAVHKFNNIGFDEAALAEPLATVVYGQERARIAFGDNVLIIGAGAIGLLHLQLALAAGASRVSVVDLDAKKLVKARTVGASHVFHERIQPRAEDEVQKGQRSRKIDNILEHSPNGYDVVIEATGAPQAVEGGMRYLKRKGRLLIFGVSPHHSEVRINPFDVYRYDWEIIGAFALNHTAGKALELLEQGRINARSVIGKQYRLEELGIALEQLAEGKADGKLQIVFD